VTPSPRIAAFIKSFEACRLESYLPTPNDRPTIGWGSTGPDITLGMTWTQAEADDRFDRDLLQFGDDVDNLITGLTTQDQFDAMVSLAYNIGMGNFGSSTLLRLHNDGDIAEVPAQFLRWNHQAGTALPGLTRRRQAEADIYEGKS
jgi:lysozyme